MSPQYRIRTIELSTDPPERELTWQGDEVELDSAMDATLLQLQSKSDEAKTLAIVDKEKALSFRGKAILGLGRFGLWTSSYHSLNRDGFVLKTLD